MDSKTTNNPQNDLVSFSLFLADSSLIMGHRLSEWTGHGPMLEQDIAISNIALDLIGQARNFYQYSAKLNNEIYPGKNTTEDELAYLRDANQFKNLLITELPNGDWSKTIGKIFFFSSWQFYFYQKLISSSDDQLAAIAEKSLKEVTYHNKWSSEWVIRLGDGTKESKKRTQNAIDDLWQYTGELFIATEFEINVEKCLCIDVRAIREDWLKKVKAVLKEATLHFPSEESWMQKGGKDGIHTEHLGFILAEMQFLQRAYPSLEW